MEIKKPRSRESRLNRVFAKLNTVVNIPFFNGEIKKYGNPLERGNHVTKTI